MANIKYDYNKYKYLLRDYLSQKGINLSGGNIHCLNPAHNDAGGASFAVYDDNAYCFGCGKKYDIYDCVGFLEGITDRAEQFKFIDRQFGSGTASDLAPYVPKTQTKDKKIADPEAQKKIKAYLEKMTALNKERIIEFLNTRARYTTKGKIKNYPEQIQNELLKYLYFWPGFSIVAEELGWQTLVAANIPGRNPTTGKSLWESSGVVFLESNGFKLHYYVDDKTKCKKFNGENTQTFPQPYHKFESTVVLVEGEMDALACNAAGLKNVFSVGGIQHPSKPEIEKYLLDVPEVIILFDNDDAGKKMSGVCAIEENDPFKTNLPEKFIQAGYAGTIKVAAFPENCPYKDIDEAIIYGGLDIVKNAIATASEYTPFEKTKKTRVTHVSSENKTTKKEQRKYDLITLKHLKSLLKKIEFSSLDKEDEYPFICAALKACDNPDRIKTLASWCEGQVAIDAKEMMKHNYSPYLLLEYCDKYGVSAYLRNELESALVPASEILKNIKKEKTIVEIDFEKIIESENFKQFLMTFAADAAANVIIEVMDGRLRYTENDKKNWFFNGHVWVREPNVAVIISPILTAIVRYWLEKNIKEKRTATKLITKIGGWPFRTGVAQNINGTKPDVWCENLPFDGPQIRGTLTLLDGVIDFSGKEIEYRKSRPEDYRREMLPYTVEEIKNAEEPKKFFDFMQGNFAEKETLETLYYYLSLIPSRNTGYKYGGIFLGPHNSGKSTTLNLVEAIFMGCCVRLKTDVLVSTGFKRFNGNEATPEIAKLEGRCAAFVQETARNAMLNTNFWKEITGGDTLTARALYQQPHDFQPTAQVIIASNYSPNFDAHDDAAISRMVVIPFKIQHHKTDKNSRTSDDFLMLLRPEYPAIIKFLITKYIDLHVNLRGNIPLSTECANYKAAYVKEQETNIDRFFEARLQIDLSDPDKNFVRVKDLYQCYLDFFELDPKSKEALSQQKLTKIIRSDHKEIEWKQRRFGGDPEPILINVRIKDWTKTEKTESEPPKQQPLLPESVKQTQSPPPPDEPPVWDDDEGVGDIF